MRAEQLHYYASDLKGLSLLAGSESVSDWIISDTLNHLRKFEIRNDLNFFLFLGDTGVGKSTVINYLSGKKMQRNPDNTIDVDGKALTKIGHKPSSETDYPLPVQSEVSPHIYLDSVGFHDTRGTAQALASAITIKWAVDSSRQIDGIVLMTSYADFTNSLHPIRSLLETLSNFFRELPPLSHSILLIVNKVPKEIQQETQNLVSEKLNQLLAEHNNKDSTRFFSSNDAIKFKKRQKILEILVASPRIIVDVLDQGDMRCVLSKALNKLNPVNKRHFSLALNTQQLQIFEDNFIYKVAVDGIRAFKNNNEKEIKEQMERFEFLKKIIVDLPSTVLKGSAVFSEKKSSDDDKETSFRQIKGSLPDIIKEFFQHWDAYQKANAKEAEQESTRSYGVCS